MDAHPLAIDTLDRPPALSTTAGTGYQLRRLRHFSAPYSWCVDLHFGEGMPCFAVCFAQVFPKEQVKTEALPLSSLSHWASEDEVLFRPPLLLTVLYTFSERTYTAETARFCPLKGARISGATRLGSLLPTGPGFRDICFFGRCFQGTPSSRKTSILCRLRRLRPNFLAGPALVGGYGN